MGDGNRRRVGGIYENRTAEWLVGQGYQILEQNYRCRIGEIDIIAAKAHTVAFVEVKFRSGLTYGMAEEAVGTVKQRRICQVARFYLMNHPWMAEWDCRFDVAAFQVNGDLHYYEGAFGGM